MRVEKKRVFYCFCEEGSGLSGLGRDFKRSFFGFGAHEIFEL